MKHKQVREQMVMSAEEQSLSLGTAVSHPRHGSGRVVAGHGGYGSSFGSAVTCNRSLRTRSSPRHRWTRRFATVSLMSRSTRLFGRRR